ncbi:hypothetical protein [Myroides sp. DW712]|uniref:hypothetical protein n=1 Tax=Myroides sp. DW712 TaxID=3389800 RepID=UPI00397C98A5
MKKGIVLILGLFAMVACNNTTKKSTNRPESDTTPEMMGGDKDDHGCLGSAGQTWSELKQKCLQLFEEGLRLDPVSTEGSAVISAFVVENEDQSKLELFLPEEDGSIILDKKAPNQYENGSYTFDVKEGALYRDKQKQYVKSFDNHNQQ